ncbi:unnamed protein product [Rangifer tarandus platyrhynchus]|uniref:Uncharacterized protein n=2 Tax=Rangifer tarandus platyrhynchus TaxID=3082113 RepID=A0ABN8XSX4_RANTA|nr:unnamed protein product [Rangifer tarandus platyrhynchus]
MQSHARVLRPSTYGFGGDTVQPILEGQSSDAERGNLRQGEGLRPEPWTQVPRLLRRERTGPQPGPQVRLGLAPPLPHGSLGADDPCDLWGEGAVRGLDHRHGS